MIKDPETGITYKSLAKLCEARGISKHAVHRAYYAQGRTLKEALEFMREREERYTDPYTGKKYRNLIDIIRLHSEVSASSVRRNLKKGMSLAMAMKKNLTVCIDPMGNTFPSFNAMARAWGCIPCNVRARLKGGHSLEVALNPKPLARRRHGNQRIS